MKTEEQKTKDIHNRMKKHFVPIEGGILIEYVRNLKTSGGIFLPERSSTTKAIAHPIIAVGDKVSPNLRPGQWISLRGDVMLFSMYGREFSIIRDFDIMMIVDMNYIKDETAFKAENPEPVEEKIDARKSLIDLPN